MREKERLVCKSIAGAEPLIVTTENQERECMHSQLFFTVIKDDCPVLSKQCTRQCGCYVVLVTLAPEP